MTFDDLVSPADVFVDANIFIYHFTSDPKYGAACTQLLERIELQQLQGFTTTHILGYCGGDAGPRLDPFGQP